MTTNSIPSSDKLPPKPLNKDTQDDELPETNVDDRRAPPVNMGNSRTAGENLTEADPKTGRADAKDRIDAPQTANRE
jgi:hypothetical protein